MAITEEQINQDIVNPNNVITPDAVNSTDKPLVPVESSASPLPDLNALRSEFSDFFNQGDTATQGQESDLIGQVQGLNDKLSGESSFRTGIESEQDIAGKQQTVNDLTGQLKQLIAQDKQIPLQLQQDAEGRGITKAGLAPIQAGELRKNAIRALGVSAMLEASQGNLSTAQSLVDRAVSAEFDPIRAEINAKIANLDLIQEKLNREQQEEADTLRLALSQQKEQIEAEASAKAEIGKIVMKLSETGVEDGNLLNAVLQAGSVEEALSLATPVIGAFAAEEFALNQFKKKLELTRLDQDISNSSRNLAIREGEFSIARNKYFLELEKFQNTRDQQDFDNFVKTQEMSELTDKDLTRIDKFAKDFDTNDIVKNYVSTQNKAESVKQIIEAGVGGPGDLALVFEFMKALDPTSVVRESEYDAASKSGNVFAGQFTKYNKGYFNPKGGILPEQVKKDFLTLINTKKSVQTAQYDNFRTEFAKKVNSVTGEEDGDEYLTDYGAVTFTNFSNLTATSSPEAIRSFLKKVPNPEVN